MDHSLNSFLFTINFYNLENKRNYPLSWKCWKTTNRTFSVDSQMLQLFKYKKDEIITK